MKRIVRFIVPVLLLGLARAGTPTNAPVSLDAIGRAMAKADTVFTRFVQERHLSLFQEPLRSEGFLCFEKPGRIRWETTSPYKSILVSDGSNVAQFEWTDQEWRRLDLGLGNALQNVVRQIADVMGGKFAGGKRGYDVEVTDTADGWIATLVPQNASMRRMMAAIDVHLSPDLKGIRRVVLRETGGDFTDIRFGEQVANLVLPPGTFDRRDPADIDIIRQAAKGRP